MWYSCFMKHYVTVDQVNELSTKGKERFIEWYNGKNFLDKQGSLEFIKSRPKWIPLPSIGQMIEFLGDEYIHAIHEYGSVEWVSADKVCDDLWKKVKEVLEAPTHILKP